MVAIAIDRVSSELGGLCHQQIQLPLGQVIKLLKLNRAIKQVALEPLWIELLGRDIQMQAKFLEFAFYGIVFFLPLFHKVLEASVKTRIVQINLRKVL